MVRNIRLMLSKITYTGGSVGRDIRVEVGVLGTMFRLNKLIKPGQTLAINSDIGNFTTDHRRFHADVSVTVIEKDWLFNDTGSAVVKINIDTAMNKHQQFIAQIQVKEKRSKSAKNKKTANFEVMLQAEVFELIRYVPDLDAGDGFLNVILEDDKKTQSLPAYLQVRVERKDAKREYITILEGHYRGRSASIMARDDGSSWFIADIEHTPPARAQYSISQKIFFLNGKKYQTKDYPEYPWIKGLYDIEIPDYFHKGGRPYSSVSKRAGTWFKIGHAGERYLHAGSRSLGCMTVDEVTRWMKIYNELIKARKGDFMSVGMIEIID